MRSMRFRQLRTCGGVSIARVGVVHVRVRLACAACIFGELRTCGGVSVARSLHSYSYGDVCVVVAGVGSSGVL